MKKLLPILLFTISAGLFAQPTVNSVSASNVTADSATINYYAAANCPQGAAVQVNYATNSGFANQTTVPAVTVFAGQTFAKIITGLQPGTQYFVRLTSNTGASCGNLSTVSATIVFTTLPGSATLPTISAVSAFGSNGSGLVSYTLNANNGNTTSLVRYGFTSDALTSQATGGVASGSAATAVTAALSGLQPDTTFYYQIEATNSAGTSTSPVSSFLVPVNQLIADYTFDNTYYDSNGNNPFQDNDGTTLTTDRNGNPNAALTVSDSGTTATIPALPYGNRPRSISIWVKLDQVSPGYNFIYSYGTGTAYNGAYLNPSTVFHFGAVGGNHAVTTTQNDSWTHFVFTYDGLTSQVFKNGVLLGSTARSWNTVNNADIFRLGLTETGVGGYFSGHLDDLKIYNYALSATEVSNLFVNNTLSVPAVGVANTDVSIYPNPASGVVNISMEAGLKMISVFSIQGQRVLTSDAKTVDVSGLAAGVYVIKIVDNNNRLVSKKLVIK
ncbi:hypothetical protein HYN48_09130 [Flavobacterium magnum]|uniref:Fibronectin type-III domain-containing protein n=1 Tax=Flavobacterium magnum TaxID=2162713 RepID=A0A2S0RG09_9FLAO|nr:LamG-like jellyroll fold domain-containing protein [Flavobacterium magnum]AWA30230.1 hypothetical protein HYN48_09130 [Flavobacterium magnum]